MRFLIPAILAMGAIVVASNILVQFRLGDLLTWGAVTYPFAFLVTDITNRILGAAAARKVVLAGFAVGLIWSLIAAGAGTTTVRIAFASAAAFLIAQMIDVQIFERLRHHGWWQAPFLSSLVGSAVDTLLFFGIAFAAFLPHDGNTEWSNELVPLLNIGPLAPVWASLGLADWLVKIALAALALVPFRIAINKILPRAA